MLVSREKVQMGVDCAAKTDEWFTLANGRVFLDAKLATKEKRHKSQTEIRKIIGNIIFEFQGLLSGLEWMSERTKKVALWKIGNLTINVGWPEMVENDEMLAEYYADLEWDEHMSYTEIVDSMKKHWLRKKFKQLFMASKNDSPVEYSTSDPSAWHKLDFNSINIPLGILNTPFYNSDFPTPLLYGGIGFIIGHEIAHLFDESGIQWDENGALENWMDLVSEKGFRRMAYCVVDQYGQFEPIKGIHIDGQMKMSENMADQGALRATFNAYRKEIAFNGQKPHQRNEQFEKFTNDQLFFLAFSQGWCQAESKNSLKERLLTDKHSPAKYRVIGSLQNFAEFHAAFNCPDRISSYEYEYEEEYCQVW